MRLNDLDRAVVRKVRAIRQKGDGPGLSPTLLRDPKTRLGMNRDR